MLSVRFKIVFLSCFIVFIALFLTDFVVLQFPLFTLSSSLILFLCFFFKILKKQSIDRNVLLYIFLVSIFFALSLTIHNYKINTLLFTPIISYFTYYVFSSHSDKNIILNYVIKTLLFIILAVSLIEIVVKLGYVDIPIYKNFILNLGDGRIDVLRVRSLFGSSLSVSAVCIVFFIYFKFFEKSSLGIMLTILLMLLSGSRTAIVIFVFITFISFLVKRKVFVISTKNILIGILMMSSFVIAIYYLGSIGLDKILLRALDIRIDDSVLGRSNTTLKTSELLVDQLPHSIIFGLESSNWISDSAFVSIAASSGLFLMFLYSLFMIRLIFKLSKLSFIKKLICAISLIVSAIMIGDMFIPFSSYIIFLILFFYTEKENGYV